MDRLKFNCNGVQLGLQAPHALPNGPCVRLHPAIQTHAHLQCAGLGAEAPMPPGPPPTTREVGGWGVGGPGVPNG